MKTLGNITTKLAVQEARMDISHVVIRGVVADVQPGPSHNSAERGRPMVAVQDDQDQFHGMEEQVCHRIIQRLRGAQPAYLPTIDDESEPGDQAPAQPRKKHRGTFGKLRMADNSN